MTEPLRLLAVLAHPDDESLGIGGTLAKYAAEGVETFLVTATLGERGRFRGYREAPEHPGAEALARIREQELRAAAGVLGIRDVALLGYLDQEVDRAMPAEVVAAIARHLRRIRPQVVLTFGPDGAYGHPDHIAISQFAVAATIAAADAGSRDDDGAAPHAVSKLYFVAWPHSTWSAYEHAFGRVVSRVDGVERQSTPWPDWEITTEIDTRAWWETAWRAVSCHQSQVSAYEGLKSLNPAQHEAIWGKQSFYRVFSLVNAGRQLERDLFEGLR